MEWNGPTILNMGCCCQSSWIEKAVFFLLWAATQITPSRCANLELNGRHEWHYTLILTPWPFVTCPPLHVSVRLLCLPPSLFSCTWSNKSLCRAAQHHLWTFTQHKAAIRAFLPLTRFWFRARSVISRVRRPLLNVCTFSFCWKICDTVLLQCFCVCPDNCILDKSVSVEYIETMHCRGERGRLPSMYGERNYSRIVAWPGILTSPQLLQGVPLLMGLLCDVFTKAQVYKDKAEYLPMTSDQLCLVRAYRSA